MHMRKPNSVSQSWAFLLAAMVAYLPANLYPVMNRFLNLADFESVKKHAWLLKLAFGLPMKDPNHMPVTRDLSSAKRDAILTFLADPQEGAGAPRKVRVTATEERKPPDYETMDAGDFAKGGKAAAAARRLILQGKQGNAR